MSTEHDHHSDDATHDHDHDPSGEQPVAGHGEPVAGRTADTGDRAGTTDIGDSADIGAPAGRATRRPRLTVAVVAAAVLLAGGGGAYWASAAGGGGHDRTAAQPLRFDDPTVVTQPEDGGSGPGAGSGTRYELTGTLPKGPDSAPVYRAAGGVDEAAVQHLAAVFGMSGPVQSTAGWWQVGGPEPVLLVSKDAPGTWTYARYAVAAVSAHPDAAVPAGPRPGPSAGGTRDPDGSGGGTAPVTEQRAMAVAAPVLNVLGLSGARIDAEQRVVLQRTVTADPVVGGLPTHGWATTLQIGPDGGVDLAYGRLSALAKGDSYPVVSAAEALKELNAKAMDPDHFNCPAEKFPQPQAQPRTPQGGAQPGNGTQATAAPTVPCGLRHTPAARIQVRGAEFGLATQSVSGAQTLVPAWLFDTTQAGVLGTAVVAQTAVDPAYVTGDGGAAGDGGAETDAPGGPSAVPPATAVDPGGPVQPDPLQPVDPLPPKPVALTGYQASGSTLTVVFWGGVCGTYQATVVETASQVQVRVTHAPGKPGRMCPMIAKALTRTLVLKQPLGTRIVVDASNGAVVAAWNGQPVSGQ